MVDFNLDTSGVVGPLQPPSGPIGHVRWSDLSPFAQGCVEALFAELNAPLLATFDLEAPDPYRFDELSPEALALILKDCEVYERHYPMKPFADYRRARGAAFWAERNSGKRTSDWAPVHFYPQTVSLGDDGKIHLSPSHEHGAAK